MTEHDNTLIQGNILNTDISSDYRVGIGAYDGGWGATPSDGSLSNVEILNNEVYGVQQGIRIGIAGKTVSGIEVTGNTIQDNDFGVTVRSSADEVTVNDNDILLCNTLGGENQDT